jgi:hypothetical protein
MDGGGGSWAASALERLGWSTLLVLGRAAVEVRLREGMVLLLLATRYRRDLSCFRRRARLLRLKTPIEEEHQIFIEDRTTAFILNIKRKIVYTMRTGGCQ